MKFVVHYWYFLLLIALVIISQIILLQPHLKYGFSDVDWGYLSIYKTENPYSPSQFIEFLRRGGTLGGIYTHQIYYMGIQYDLFGLNFKAFQGTTHTFKILAILANFAPLLAISGSFLAAFIATILFAFSYSTVGTMYTVATSSDFSAVFSMGIFTTFYWYVVKKESGNWLLILILLLLLIITLFLSTERMYPLPLFIGVIEVSLFWQKGRFEKNAKKRLAVLFLPLTLIFLIKPVIFLSFLQHGVEIVQGIKVGNWNLVLTPFIVLGSILLPIDLVKYFGVVKMENWHSFLDYLISGPLPILTVITIVLGLCIFKRPHIKILQILILLLISSFFLYIAGSHFVTHLINIESITQAVVGLYILIFATVSFLYWLKIKEKLLVGLFAGPILAILYILLTWVGASAVEVFSGAHRYLTIPALGISLFLGTLMALLFKRLKFFAIAPVILLLFLFIKVNTQEIRSFFNAQLQNGFSAEDKQLMRKQLLDMTSNLSTTKPSLFYFDFSEDQDRGYYYDNTLTGGFSTWMLWHPRINFNRMIAPRVFWNDPAQLKSVYTMRNNQKGFVIENNFFEWENFYAFRLKEKKVYDIKDEILIYLGQ